MGNFEKVAVLIFLAKKGEICYAIEFVYLGGIILNLKLMLAGLAARYRDKPAIICEEQKLSYSDLDEASNRVANALISMGINKGDRIVLLLNNSPEYVVTYFGIVKIGAIAVPLDPKYKIDEL